LTHLQRLANYIQNIHVNQGILSLLGYLFKLGIALEQPVQYLHPNALLWYSFNKTSSHEVQGEVNNL
jgi:hypothetical protein